MMGRHSANFSRQRHFAPRVSEFCASMARFSGCRTPSFPRSPPWKMSRDRSWSGRIPRLRRQYESLLRPPIRRSPISFSIRFPSTTRNFDGCAGSQPRTATRTVHDNAAIYRAVEAPSERRTALLHHRRKAGWISPARSAEARRDHCHRTSHHSGLPAARRTRPALCPSPTRAASKPHQMSACPPMREHHRAHRLLLT